MNNSYIDNSDIPDEENQITTNNSVSIDIGKLIDTNEFSPAKNSLESYVGQKIKLIGFEDTTPKIFKKANRDTIIFKFIDEKQKVRNIMTSAKFVVTACHTLRDKFNFGAKDSNIKSIDCVLVASGHSKRFKAIHLVSVEDAKKIFEAENKNKKAEEMEE